MSRTIFHQFHFYAISPIDFWGGGAMSVANYVLYEPGICQGGRCAPLHPWRQLEYLVAVTKMFNEFHDVFLAMGWEGDIRDGPYVMSIPDQPSCAMAYAIKQDNNGDTFVASTIPLPHLAADCRLYRKKNLSVLEECV